MSSLDAWANPSYCWVVICKNAIPLAETDPFEPLPSGPFLVQCDECGEEHSYDPAEVLRLEFELPNGFTTHPRETNGTGKASKAQVRAYRRWTTVCTGASTIIIIETGSYATCFRGVTVDSNSQHSFANPQCGGSTDTTRTPRLGTGNVARD